MFILSLLLLDWSYNHYYDICLFSYLGISSYVSTVYICLGIKIVFTFSLRNFEKFDFLVSTQYIIFTIGEED